MDDLAIGRVFRELRIRLGWRAADVARRATTSTSTYSRIERGEIERVKIATLRRVAGVLEVRLVLEPRWRGAGLDRLFSSRHASMAVAVTQMLLGRGWEVRPEVSFSHFGERGVVDLIAWRVDLRTLLLIELKTELVGINELLATTDRRRRLAHVISEPLGWHPATVAQWIVIAASRTNARRVAEHRAILRAAFPADGRSVSGWLARPTTAASALWFLPDSHGARRGRGSAPTQRVRVQRPSVVRPSEPA